MKEFPRASLFCDICLCNSVLILLMRHFLNERTPLVIVLFEGIQRWETLLTVMAWFKFYIPGLQYPSKLLGITLTKHNPNMWRERRELRSGLHKERVPAPTAPKQDCSSSVSVQLHLKTFTCAPISLFVLVLKEMLNKSKNQKQIKKLPQPPKKDRHAREHKRWLPPTSKTDNVSICETRN